MEATGGHGGAVRHLGGQGTVIPQGSRGQEGTVPMHRASWSGGTAMLKGHGCTAPVLERPERTLIYRRHECTALEHRDMDIL